GRPRQVTGPYEQGPEIATISYAYRPDALVPWARTRNYDPLHPDDPIETFTFIDGLGRILQTKKDGAVHVAPGINAKDVRIVSGRVQYDPWGRVVQTYHPRAEEGGRGSVFSSELGGGATLVSYDACDRVLSTQLPDGATTTMQYGTMDAGGTAWSVTTVIDAE